MIRPRRGGWNGGMQQNTLAGFMFDAKMTVRWDGEHRGSLARSFFTWPLARFSTFLRARRTARQQ